MAMMSLSNGKISAALLSYGMIYCIYSLSLSKTLLCRGMTVYGSLITSTLEELTHWILKSSVNDDQCFQIT